MAGGGLLLVVTGGDAAVAGLAAALPGATVLPWRDMLHDGPVPPGLPLAELSALRAAWLADDLGLDAAEVAAGFRARDAMLEAVRPGTEVLLCFEHDLYDQLQLAQVLAELAPRAGEVRLSLAQADRHLASLTRAELASLVEHPRPLGPDALATAGAVWEAFWQPTPEGAAGARRPTVPGAALAGAGRPAPAGGAPGRSRRHPRRGSRACRSAPTRPPAPRTSGGFGRRRRSR